MLSRTRLPAALTALLLLVGVAQADPPSARLDGPKVAEVGPIYLDAYGTAGDAVAFEVLRFDRAATSATVSPLYDASGALDSVRLEPDGEGLYLVVVVALGPADAGPPEPAIAFVSIGVHGPLDPPDPPLDPDPPPGPVPSDLLSNAAANYIDAKAIGYGMALPAAYRDAADRVEAGTIAYTGQVSEVLLGISKAIEGINAATSRAASERLAQATADASSVMVDPDGTIRDRAGYAAVLRRIADAMEGASRGK